MVLCNAITGEMQDYRIDEVPEWIDRAYSADLLVQLYDYYGTLKHGYFNSVLSQKDCLKTTNGYNYLAIDDDVWVYTGVTSVNIDHCILFHKSCIILKCHKVSRLPGNVKQQRESRPILQVLYLSFCRCHRRILDRTCHRIILCLHSSLVHQNKSHIGLVNVQKYQVVAIGDTVSVCEESYNNLLLTNGIKEKEEVKMDTGTIEGKITKIAQGVIDGDSHYYIMLEGSDEIFDVSVVDFIEIIKYNVGDDVKLEYAKGDKANTVLSLK